MASPAKLGKLARQVESAGSGRVVAVASVVAVIRATKNDFPAASPSAAVTSSTTAAGAVRKMPEGVYALSSESSESKIRLA
jgi:hypothetical protein